MNGDAEAIRDLYEKIRRTFENVTAPDPPSTLSLGSMVRGQMNMVGTVTGRASGKSMSFGSNYGMVPTGFAIPPPKTATLIADGELVRVTVSVDALVQVMSIGSRKWREVARVPLDRARAFARELRRVDVTRVTLLGHDGSVESEQRRSGARVSCDRSSLRLRFRPPGGCPVTVRSTFKRVKTFSSSLEGLLNEVALDDVMGA